MMISQDTSVLERLYGSMGISMGKDQKGKAGAGSNASKTKDNLTYSLRLRCRETDGQIHSTPVDGTLKFAKDDVKSFKRKVEGLPALGEDVSFTAKKVGDTSSGRRSAWTEYSMEAYERERVDRWH